MYPQQIRIIDKCYKDECEKRNLAKDRELLDYTPFTEECNYDEFYTIVELRRVASPLIVTDKDSVYGSVIQPTLLRLLGVGSSAISSWGNGYYTHYYKGYK